MLSEMTSEIMLKRVFSEVKKKKKTSFNVFVKPQRRHGTPFLRLLVKLKHRN